MASYELLALNEATPQAVAPTAADTGVVTNLSVTTNAAVGGTLGVTGATTLSSTLGVTGAITNTAGTANGVAYLNGSKVLTSGSALTFSGSALTVTGTVSATGATTIYTTGSLPTAASVLNLSGASSGTIPMISLFNGSGGERCRLTYRTDNFQFGIASGSGDLTTPQHAFIPTGLSVTGSVAGTTTIRSGGYTVATLPAGSSGDRAYVTDATTPAYNTALTGGGAVVVPVFKNATVWVSC